VDFAIVAFLGGLSVFLRITRRIDIACYVGSTVIGVYFVYLFLDGSVGISATYWLYSYPILVLFMLGALRGSLLFALWMLALASTILFRDSIAVYEIYTPSLLLRFYGSMLVVYSFTLVFEWTRKQTERKLEESRSSLNDLAHRDGLTGLYNRRFLANTVSVVLDQLKRTGTELAFLMFDLDNFKAYNDTYGHRAGDAVIAGFAGILQSSLRRDTDYAFRYGGEEFALFLSSTNRKTAEEFAERILKATRDMSIPHEGSAHRVVTVSCGAVLVTIGRDTNLPVLVDAADQALYEAKSLGRNRYVFRPIEAKESP